MKRDSADIAALFDPDPRRRLAAVTRVGDRPEDRYALRDVLLADRDGRMRARAASRLGSRRGPPMGGALLEAARLDELPSVRQAAWRSLARLPAPNDLKDAHLRAAARRALQTESTWWVRVAVVAALARASSGEGASESADDLRDVLLDPFWRVRHAAIKRLRELGSTDEIRQRIQAAASRSAIESAALLYLERAWSGDSAVSFEPSLALEPPADPIWDADPAVIAARLADPRSSPTLGLLVELLADPHAETRRLAAERLATRGVVREVRAALEWLEEPRIPYASAAAASLAAHLGDRIIELVRDVLDGESGTGALCWALAWVAETRSGEFLDSLTRLLEHPSAQVRRQAILAARRLGGNVEVAGLLDRLAGGEIATDGDDLPCAIDALAAGAPERLAALARRRTPAELPLAARRQLAAAAGRLPSAWLIDAATDRDPATRAAALAELSARRELSSAARAEAFADPDPWIRAAVVCEEIAPSVVIGDLDPNVRRAALRHCRSGAIARPARLAAAASADPRLRADAADSLDLTDPSELTAIFALTTDRQVMARAAAASRLETAADPDAIDRAARMLADQPRDEVHFAAAMTWLCRRFDASAVAMLESTWARRDLSVANRAHLRAIRLALPDHLACEVPAAEPARRRAHAKAPIVPGELATARQLGASGVTLPPLIISGVKDLAMGSLRRGFDAGANAFFWEPRYHKLGAFLRRPEIGRHAVVVAGSYHGTAEAIEADVELACRRLRREVIDVFLIFWVRSENRLSDEVWDCLQRLKDRGRIRACGFSTHHRELAADAISARPWDVIMVRHSAAHPSAEDSLLSIAEDRGVGVLAFTSLCYGRLLEPSPAREKTRAPECYRYSLSQPGVSAVLTAPSRHRELLENLTVLEQPTFYGVGSEGEVELGSMREHGAWIYSQSRDFAALVRRTPLVPVRLRAARRPDA